MQPAARGISVTSIFITILLLTGCGKQSSKPIRPPTIPAEFFTMLQTADEIVLRYENESKSLDAAETAKLSTSLGTAARPIDIDSKRILAWGNVDFKKNGRVLAIYTYFDGGIFGKDTTYIELNPDPLWGHFSPMIKKP